MDARITFRWVDTGIAKPPSCIRDLWRHIEQQETRPEYTAAVSGHCVVLLRIR